MKRTKLIVLAFALLLGTEFSVMAADIKIGVIDTQKILIASSYGKSAKAEIQKKIEELTNKLKTSEDELAAMKEKYEREGLVMSQEMREQKEREFRIKVGDFQASEKKAKQEMAELNMKLSGRIQQDVSAIVEEIGKKEGYLLIIEKGSLMYAQDSIDISDQVISIYNKNFEAESKTGDKK